METAPATATESSAGPSAKHNPYAEAAQPERYRVADAPLFSCAAHREACVLCTTAGKNGRNGRTAAVGATLFWLTCPHLNALVARMEGHRCVQAVTTAMTQHAALLQSHVASHELYAARARALLSETQWSFFASHFLSQEDAQLHKFGNAAVSHAEDMKCLHALVAQTLAGAANPVGSLVLNYVNLLYQVTLIAEQEVASHEEKLPSFRAALDSTELFVSFVDTCVAHRTAAGGNSGVCSSPSSSELLSIPFPGGERLLGTAEVAYTWLEDASLPALEPDVCARALRVLTFLEGKPPRRHKKHRIN